MITFIVSIFLTSCAHAALVSGKVEILPSDIASELASMVTGYAWYCQNDRDGYDNDKNNDIKQHDDAKKQLTQLVKNFWPDGVVDTLDSMASGYAWYVQNQRAGYDDDAAHDISQYNNAKSQLYAIDVFTSTFVDRLDALVTGYAWFVNDNRKGYHPNQENDSAQYQKALDDLTASTTSIVDVWYNVDMAEIIQKTPLVWDKQTLNNCNGDHQQSMEYDFADTFTKSSSYTNKVSFGCTYSTEVDESIIVESVKETFSISFNYEHSWTHSETSGTTKTYKFPLVVGPNSAQQAQATVTEAKMNIPYVITVSFDGNLIDFSGVWTGVATSSANYKVENISCEEVALRKLAKLDPRKILQPVRKSKVTV